MAQAFDQPHRRDEASVEPPLPRVAKWVSRTMANSILVKLAMIVGLVCWPMLLPFLFVSVFLFGWFALVGWNVLTAVRRLQFRPDEWEAVWAEPIWCAGLILAGPVIAVAEVAAQDLGAPAFLTTGTEECPSATPLTFGIAFSSDVVNVVGSLLARFVWRVRRWRGDPRAIVPTATQIAEGPHAFMPPRTARRSRAASRASVGGLPAAPGRRAT